MFDRNSGSFAENDLRYQRRLSGKTCVNTIVKYLSLSLSYRHISRIFRARDNELTVFVLPVRIYTYEEYMHIWGVHDDDITSDSVGKNFAFT